MVSLKTISFDMDGTLTDNGFVDTVWLEGIPQLYSIERKISFEDAKKAVKSEYDKVGREDLLWYDINHWIKKFGLNIDWKNLLTHFENKIKTYPEVPKVLEQLKQKGFRPIIITNAAREFLEFEVKKTKMGAYFERVFSSTSDFRLVKKAVDLYQRVCAVLEISPQNLIHVGDDWKFDFYIPRKLGISAFYLDRSGEKRGEFTIKDLEELERKLQKLGY